MKSLVLVVLSFAFYQAVVGTIEYTNDIINIEVVDGGLTGDGYHTGYWDCCKPSCAWTGNSHTDPPVTSCGIDGVTAIDDEVQSGCADVGSSYMCSNQVGFAVNDTFALGFTAASFAGGTDYSMCCRCVLLEWIHDSKHRQLVVQITNTGGDLLVNQFDLAIPGCGVGYNADGCSKQWGAPHNGWGQQYGGVATEEECKELPEQLQAACEFRFEWLNKDLPDNQNTFKEVVCPKQLTDISRCVI